MSKSRIFIPEPIEKESDKIDKIIRQDNISGIINWAIGVIYFGGALGGVFWVRNINYFVIWAVAIIFFIVIKFVYRKEKIGERKALSYNLIKIINGINSGGVDYRYLKFLNKKLFFTDKKKIIERHLVFENYHLKENMFFRGLKELVTRINHANKNNKLDKLDVESLKELVINIYYSNKGVLELLLKINNSYKGKENLLKTKDHIKIFFYSKKGKVLLWELFLVSILLIIYNFFYSNLEVLIPAFCVLSAPAIYSLFNKQP